MDVYQVMTATQDLQKFRGDKYERLGTHHLQPITPIHLN
jgi:hypothetical protein